MNDLSMNTLAQSIAALGIRRVVLLHALQRGESVPGEDDDHLPDLLDSVEGALGELRQAYESRLDNAGLYLSYAELTAIDEE